VQSVQSVEKEATCWCQDCKMDLCFWSFHSVVHL
jgi:hypothetical protein